MENILTKENLQELTNAFLDEFKNNKSKTVHVDALFELANLMINLHPGCVSVEDEDGDEYTEFFDTEGNECEPSDLIDDIESILESIASDLNFKIDSGCGSYR